MQTDYKIDPAAGPVQNMFQTFCTGLDAAGFGFEPMMKAAARSNLEALALASRRTQAYMELPARLGQCRTPQDLATEQMRFWQTMTQHYTECCQHVMETWTSLARETGQRARSERDYITFPEPQESDTEQGARTPGQRRAA